MRLSLYLGNRQLQLITFLRINLNDIILTKIKTLNGIINNCNKKKGKSKKK